MAEIIEMPKMSDTMEEGVLVSWLVKEGDEIQSGDVIAEVETDKATMDLPTYVSGTVLHLAFKAGDALPIGALLAIVGKPGEDISALLADKTGGAKAATPSSPAAEAPVSVAAVAPVAPVAASPTAQATDSRLKASPLAKALATELGINLQAIQGSGDGGRIVKRDIEAALQAAPAVQAPTAVAHTAPLPAPESPGTEVALSQMRKTIARRLSESKFSAPHFYLTIPIRMDNAAAFRQQLNEQSEVKISFNDLIVKACAVALRKHPKVNASFLGDRIRFHEDVNIGVAVAIDEGLIVPVIRHADRKGLAAIATETKELAGKAKNKGLQPHEFSGNTFSISNLGMYGIEEFTAIINPPDVCILAVGAIQKQAVVEGDQLMIGSVMRVTLSCDHRAVDGAVGSAFLQTLQSLLENPLRLLL